MSLQDELREAANTVDKGKLLYTENKVALAIAGGIILVVGIVVGALLF